jgi:hypothetical protein
METAATEPGFSRAVGAESQKEMRHEEIGDLCCFRWVIGRASLPETARTGNTERHSVPADLGEEVDR